MGEGLVRLHIKPGRMHPLDFAVIQECLKKLSMNALPCIALGYLSPVNSVSVVMQKHGWYCSGYSANESHTKRRCSRSFCLSYG